MKQYKPDGKVLTAFLRDDESRLKCVRGPVGSGKSTAACMALFMLMAQQPPQQRDGKRRSRMVVVRNTNDELRRTTIASWKQMFPPEEWGRFYDTPPYRHEIRVGDIECDVYFLALDSEEDKKKLLSFEITAAWVNEAREVPRSVISALLGRIGRYPAKADGGCRKKMVILDTNAPAVEHWIGIMEGTVAPPANMPEEEQRDLVKPDDWAFYIQPGALLEETDNDGNHVAFLPNPDAENLNWIDGGIKYYTDYVKGIPLDQARVDVCNMLGRVQTGRPVWPMFKRGLHVAKHPLEPFPNVPLMVGVDFGLTPAAVIGQSVNGRWLILKELVADEKAGMGAVTFAPLLKAFLAQHYPGFRYALIGDPAGDQRAQSDERSPFMIFRACGLPILPAQTNDFVVRKEAVESALNRLVNGYAGLLFDPGCLRLITACEFGYRYAKLKTSDGRYSDQPVKDMHSHCFAPCTPVSMADGTRKMISAVNVGDMVATPDGPKPVTAVMGRWSNDLVRLDFSNGVVIFCTADHPFPVNGIGIVQARSLLGYRVDAQGMGTQETGIVICSYVDRLPAQGMVVHDLTVADAHMFYANGILTHNCADAFQYLLLGGGEGRALLTGSDAKRKPVNTLKKKGKRR